MKSARKKGKNGRMEGGKDGRMEGWKDGRMEEKEGKEGKKGFFSRFTFHVSRLTFHASRSNSHLHAYQIFVLIFLALTPTLLWVPRAIGVEPNEVPNRESGISITLRKEVFLPKGYITLSDVADIACEDGAVLEELKSIQIGTVPLPGHSRFLSLNLLKMYLRNHVDLKEVEFLGPSGVKVFPETITVSKSLILERIKDYIRRTLTEGSEISLELEGYFREFEVYKGELEFEVGVSGKLVSVKIMRDGVPQRTLYLPVRVTLTGAFAVAQNAIPGKAVFKADDVALQKIRLEGAIADIPLSDLASLNGKRAKVSIHPGQAIRASMVEEVPLVERGDRVTILFKTSPLLISTFGKAEEEGTMGKIIRVVNLSSQKRIYAEIVGEKLVQVTNSVVERR